MKKVMKKVITILCICLLLTGCGETSESSGETKDTEEVKYTNMFVTVESKWSYKVVYCRDTKVMYVMSDSGYNTGTFTLLVNADGTPMVYTESEDKK